MGCIDRSKVFTPKSFPGYKTISSKQHGQSSGRMSSAHGTTTKNATKGMSNATGRIGSDTRSFSKNYKQGPCPIGKRGRSY